jgi:hypothetical protein
MYPITTVAWMSTALRNKDDIESFIWQSFSS